MSQSLTVDEMNHLVALLRRFASHDLDQHDACRLDTPYGPVYVTFSRELPADHNEQTHRGLPG